MQPFNPQAASLAPFAMVEQAINASTQRMLSNATATWQGGEPFGVVFDRRPHEALDVAMYAPSCSLPLACAPGLEQGSVLVIDGVEWTVIEPVVSDSSGWTTVQLREGGDV